MQKVSEADGSRPQAGNWGRIARWALAVAWMGLIFWFSAQPKGDLPDYGGLDLLVKKTAHVAEYAVLGWLIQRARGSGGSWWQPWLIAIAYAATDEFHQLFVPGRGARVVDVMIDSAGAAMGLALAVWRP